MAPPPDSDPAIGEDRTRRSRTFRLRVVSAAVMLPFILSAVYFGFPAFDLVLVAAALLMAREWARLTGRGRHRIAAVGLSVAVVVMLLLVVLGFGFERIALVTVLAAIGLYALARLSGYESALWMAAGVLAIGVPCMAIDWLRNGPGDGQSTVFWILAVVWATDTGAYAFGRMIGGPRLAPRISPNKTWAGLAGGMGSAAVTGGVVGALLGAIDPMVAALVAAALAVVAQCGDLGESIVKRHFGVKDTGTLIPGHGGLLDRVDGLLTVVPTVALITWLTGVSLLDWS